MNKRDFAREILGLLQERGHNITLSSVLMIIDGYAIITHQHIERGESAILPKIGILQPVLRGKKTARNISTGETMLIQPRVGAKFVPSSLLKNVLPKSIPV